MKKKVSFSPYVKDTPLTIDKILRFFYKKLKRAEKNSKDNIFEETLEQFKSNLFKLQPTKEQLFNSTSEIITKAEIGRASNTRACKSMFAIMREYLSKTIDPVEAVLKDVQSNNLNTESLNQHTNENAASTNASATDNAPIEIDNKGEKYMDDSDKRQTHEGTLSQSTTITNARLSSSSSLSKLN